MNNENNEGNSVEKSSNIKMKIILIVLLLSCVGGAGIYGWMLYRSTPPKPEAENDLFPEQFERLRGKWFKDGDTKAEFLAIERDSFVEELHRQVGVNGDNDLPFPTVCHYQQLGKKAFLKNCPPPEEDIKQYCIHQIGDEEIQSEFILTYTAYDIKLIESSENSPHCTEFIRRQAERIKSRNGLPYSYPFQFIGGSNLLVLGRDRYVRF